MVKHRTLILTILIITTLGILTFRGCRYDWSPHYLDNNAVIINEKLFSPDSSASVVYYTLDVGARGNRLYKSLLKEIDYDGELKKHNLPPEIVVINWEDNGTLNVIYDPNEIYRLGALYSKLDLTKDTIYINGIKLIVRERISKKDYSP
ncbi:MAG: hypothetical protein ACXIUQ_02915 [Cecembia sp.]